MPSLLKTRNVKIVRVYEGSVLEEVDAMSTDPPSSRYASFGYIPLSRDL